MSLSTLNVLDAGYMVIIATTKATVRTTSGKTLTTTMKWSRKVNYSNSIK